MLAERGDASKADKLARILLTFCQAVCIGCWNSRVVMPGARHLRRGWLGLTGIRPELRRSAQGSEMCSSVFSIES